MERWSSPVSLRARRLRRLHQHEHRPVEHDRTTGGTSGTRPVSDPNADQRLAEAKTVAVGFFEAQAVNDFDKALARSSGAAATTIKWAQAVNTLKPANSTPYQVPTVAAPNVRLQIDQLASGPGGSLECCGVCRAVLPARLDCLDDHAGAQSRSTNVPRSPSTYVIDLLFSPDGDHLRLDDYRLDDTPYPVSQLFLELSAKNDTGALSGAAVLGHRDLDGSVQYTSEVTNQAKQGTEQPRATSFIWKQPDTTKPPTETPGQVLTDTVPSGATGARPCRSSRPCSRALPNAASRVRTRTGGRIGS